MEPDEKLKKEEEKRALASAYAKYLKEHNLSPGDATFIEPGELEINEKAGPTQAELPKAPKRVKKRHPKLENFFDEVEIAFASPVFVMDKIQNKVGNALSKLVNAVYKETENILTTYKRSRKAIATAFLTLCVLCAVMLIVFNKFTAYEYSYNGKVLGYVRSQDDVTNVLQIASEQLNKVNTETEQDIEFVANDNISFKMVKSAGKDMDDADMTINKLAYMTDVEVEASAIYDGDNLVTIVKDEKTAENLLANVKKTLGTPDEGMECISSEFSKPLEIKPINVLLASVQSDSAAKEQMTKGGKAKFYHLIEENEDIKTVTNTFGVTKSDIYNEENTEILSSVNSGDTVCIHKNVTPVSVEMIEKGKMKEIIPYETIEKKSDKYYIGDEVVAVKGVDGVQIVDGTLTKVGGKVVKRDIKYKEVITEKVDKITYIGTNKRPRTAPTGIFKNPLKAGTYIITSRPGWRWGRQHEGVDMGASTGTHIYASDGGKVIRASWYNGYGNCVDIQHDNGWITRYGHMSYIEVHVGQGVYQGQYIGNVGSTGNSTGPHLHFETRHNGAFVDPDTKVQGGL